MLDVCIGGVFSWVLTVTIRSQSRGICVLLLSPLTYFILRVLRLLSCCSSHKHTRTHTHTGHARGELAPIDSQNTHTHLLSTVNSTWKSKGGSENFATSVMIRGKAGSQDCICWGMYMKRDSLHKWLLLGCRMLPSGNLKHCFLAWEKMTYQLLQLRKAFLI